MSQTYQFGLLGYRIGYSLSPAIFEAMFAESGVAGTFELIDVEPQSLERDFPRLIESGLGGMSVTIPHKQSVVALLDRLDKQAEGLMAVNSISITEKGTTGYNTDVDGFMSSLAPFAGTLKKGNGLVLGYGGGARAVVFALLNHVSVEMVYVTGRDQERAELFRAQMGACIDRNRLNVISPDELVLSSLPRWDIIVNCTPLGGFNYPDAELLPESLAIDSSTLYYDLNYNQNNGALHRVEKSGARCIDGSHMLIGQAVRSFALWTGIKVEAEAIYRQVFGR